MPDFNIEPDGIKPFASDRTTVLLPCEPDQFRDFIAGLLGKPQIIERVISGPFTVTSSDIENLYHLIDQRLSSQNDATLIQFTARIVYDDKSSVLLNSFADFISYKEVKPLISTAAHLSWTFLVKFRNKSVPEKQQIDISFIAGKSRAQVLDSFVLRALSLRDSDALKYGRGDMILRIGHTDRTWGTDIEALLTGHLQTLVRKDSEARQLVRRFSGWIGFLTGFVLIGSVTFAGWTGHNRISKYMTSDARSLIESASGMDLGELTKLTKATLQYLIEKPDEKYLGPILITGFFLSFASVVFGAVVATLAESTKPSFVALTNKAEESRKIEMQRDQNNWSSFLISIGGALLISVIGNGLFFLILKYYLQ